MNRAAVMSPCGLYRYTLLREWNPELGRLGFILLNPSDADAARDDPTSRKCVGFAERLGFGSTLLVNMFAFRSTDPAGLRRVADPIGPLNNQFIKEAIRDCAIIICAWGTNSPMPFRSGEIKTMLKMQGARPMALHITKEGHPGHPLYLPYTSRPVAFA